MQEVSELETRLKYGGAVKKDGKVFCSVHPKIELNNDGSCRECLKTESIMGSDMQEAQAMNKAQEIYENDDYFE